MCELHLLELCSCPKPWSSGEAFEVLIGWFVCVAGASEMCLGTRVDGCVCGSQPVRARVGAGKALTASRLPAWHQNRWMSLIVTVCNLLNSIISCLSLCRPIQHLSLVHSPRQSQRVWEEYPQTAEEVLILFITLGDLPHLLPGATAEIKGR